jgi:lysozyme family protein
MPTIQPYEQQVLPQGFDTSQASANTVNTGAGLAALGHGMQAAGDTMFRVQEQQEASAAQAKVADLRMQITKEVLDAENSAKPGDMGYAERINGIIQQRIEKMGDQFSTAHGKTAFSKAAASLQATFVDRALGYQQQLAGQQAVVDFNNTQQADGRTLMMDPAQYEAIKKERTEQILSGQGNFAHLNMAKRAELVSHMNQQNAWAANYAMVQKDPEGWMKRTGVESAVNRMNGVPVGGVPSAGDGFQRAMAFVFPHEGGYNKNDGNGHPVNLGINQGANPDVDVKNLTKDQAAQIYRTRYWNAIGGDKLPPGVSLFAMDAAVNMGVGAAKEMLAATGGDLQKMAAWREDRYRAIAAANPEKAKYLNTWLSRNKDAVAAASGAGGTTAAAAAAGDPQVFVSAQRLNPTLGDLSPQQFISLVNHAETLQNQQMAVNKAQLEQDWKNQMSQAMTTGQVGAPIPVDRFIKSYGAAEGTRKYNDEYKPALELGQHIQQAYGQTVAQQDATLNSMKPVPDTPGYAEAQKRYETFANAVNTVRRAREQDPIGFAIQQKIGGVQPLDMTTPDHMADGVAARVAPARAMQRDFGVSQLTLMSAPEAEGMRRAFGQMPSSQQIGYLAALQAKVNDPEAFRAVVSQIAPDSPETQVAAHLVNQMQPTTVQTHWFRPDETVNGKEAAALILEGKQLLNRSKETKQNDGQSRGFPMPKDQELRQAFIGQVGNAFAGNEPGYEAAYQSVRAYYAGKAARLGKLDSQDAPDSKMVEEAVKAVTGGTYEQNGQTVIKPYGMKDNDFRTALETNGRAALTAAGLKGYATDPTAYRLMGAGDGQYWVLNGTEPVRGNDGAKVMIDVTQKPQAAPAAPAVVPNADKGQRAKTGKAGR